MFQAFFGGRENKKKTVKQSGVPLVIELFNGAPLCHLMWMPPPIRAPDAFAPLAWPTARRGISRSPCYWCMALNPREPSQSHAWKTHRKCPQSSTNKAGCTGRFSARRLHHTCLSMSPPNRPASPIGKPRLLLWHVH